MTVLSITKSEDVPLAPIDGKPTLVYWNSAGWSNPIRLALTVANVDFVDARIEAGDPSDSASFKKAWMDAKHVLGSTGILEFPNLPYYMEGDSVKLVQSEAIVRHVARKYNLYPTSMPEHRFMMLSEEIKDYDGYFILQSYVGGPDVISQFIKEGVPNKLAIWGKIAHDGNALIDGPDGKINILDIKLYCFLRKVKFSQEELNIKPSAQEGWVDAYMKRVEDVPQVKAYLDSDYLHRPLNNPHATFASK
ncbi:glutathione S-transferase family protein [Skeletonema marinoi]|uniref:glutathione transferase n=1 Tax=Skeletonema marinoi TaxID=267567 RepID=A0AAD8Y0I0_9STRA|nr:glutathione S-transferase family protein [Skeletonema marinoi]